MTKLWVIFACDPSGRRVGLTNSDIYPDVWVIFWIGENCSEQEALDKLAEFKEADDTRIFWIGEVHNA